MRFLELVWEELKSLKTGEMERNGEGIPNRVSIVRRNREVEK